jgi:hypothetical protein
LGDLAEHALQASLRWFTVAAGVKPVWNMSTRVKAGITADLPQ